MFIRQFKQILNTNMPAKKSYFKDTYPESHWACHIPKQDDEDFIAILNIFDVQVALKLNSTDARGYRAIVGLVNEKDMTDTFNREYTDTEKLALNTALCILTSVYERYNLAVQTEIAGNNSQAIAKDGALQMGNDKEPSLLHGHVIGRGNPDACYIGNVPLRGPVAGKLFNMRGDGNDEGNTAKVKWQPGEMREVADILAKDLQLLLQNSSAYNNLAKIISLRSSLEENPSYKP